MATLFQLDASMTQLKSIVKEMAPLWHQGDSILLLGETAAYLSWFREYIEDLNADEEFEYPIQKIQSIYVLKNDIDKLNTSARINIDITTIKQLSDEDWVLLTQNTDRVVTLNSIT